MNRNKRKIVIGLGTLLATTAIVVPTTVLSVCQNTTTKTQSAQQNLNVVNNNLMSNNLQYGMFLAVPTTVKASTTSKIGTAIKADWNTFKNASQKALQATEKSFETAWTSLENFFSELFLAMHSTKNVTAQESLNIWNARNTLVTNIIQTLRSDSIKIANVLMYNAEAWSYLQNWSATAAKQLSQKVSEIKAETPTNSFDKFIQKSEVSILTWCSEALSVISNVDHYVMYYNATWSIDADNFINKTFNHLQDLWNVDYKLHADADKVIIAGQHIKHDIDHIANKIDHWFHSWF